MMYSARVSPVGTECAYMQKWVLHSRSSCASLSTSARSARTRTSTRILGIRVDGSIEAAIGRGGGESGARPVVGTCPQN